MVEEPEAKQNPARMDARSVSLNEIRHLAVESTDCDLHETWTPWNDGDLGLEQWDTEEKDKEKACRSSKHRTPAISMSWP